MAMTLSIINNLICTDGEVVQTAKQGAKTSGFSDRFAVSDVVTMTGYVLQRGGTLATATAITIYQDDQDYPQDFAYAHFWCSVAMYIQTIAGSTNCVWKVAAKTPWVISGFDSVQIAANSTAITGGTEPTPTDIDKLVIANYSGGSGDWLLTLVY